MISVCLKGFRFIQNSQLSYIDREASLFASAHTKGDGGKIIIWSDGPTFCFGRIEAKGGPTGGDGGFAEVSGLSQLFFDTIPNLSAENGAPGTLLLDPADVHVTAGATTGSFSPSGVYDIGPVAPSIINNGTLNGILNTPTNVLIQTDNGDFFSGTGSGLISAPITWTSNAELKFVHQGTFLGGSSFTINSTITNTGGGSFVSESFGQTSINANINMSGGTGTSDVFSILDSAGLNIPAGVNISAVGGVNLDVSRAGFLAGTITTDTVTINSNSLKMYGIVDIRLNNTQITTADSATFTYGGLVDIYGGTNVTSSGAIDIMTTNPNNDITNPVSLIPEVIIRQASQLKAPSIKIQPRSGLSVIGTSSINGASQINVIPVSGYPPFIALETNASSLTGGDIYFRGTNALIAGGSTLSGSSITFDTLAGIEITGSTLTTLSGSQQLISRDLLIQNSTLQADDLQIVSSGDSAFVHLNNSTFQLSTGSIDYGGTLTINGGTTVNATQSFEISSNSNSGSFGTPDVVIQGASAITSPIISITPKRGLELSQGSSLTGSQSISVTPIGVPLINLEFLNSTVTGGDIFLSGGSHLFSGSSISGGDITVNGTVAIALINATTFNATGNNRFNGNGDLTFQGAVVNGENNYLTDLSIIDILGSNLSAPTGTNKLTARSIIIRNSNLQSSEGFISSRKTVQLIGSQLSATNGMYQIVVDHKGNSPLDIGTGSLQMDSSSSITAPGGIQIWTARQQFNQILGLLNGAKFTPGPIYVNSLSEYWDTFFPTTPLNGLPFAVYYKDSTESILAGLTLVGDNPFIRIAEGQQQLLSPFDEYLRLSLQFNVLYEDRRIEHTKWMSSLEENTQEEYYIRRRTFYDNSVPLIQPSESF